MARDWRYEMRELGFNYRMTELQAALGVSQMKRLGAFKARRREIVKFYNERLGLPHLREEEFSNACFHLYPVLLENRAEVYRKARERGLFLQVHYIPVYSQPYYRSLGLYDPRDYPNAEEYYRKTISLPLYPALTDADLEEIARRLGEIL